MHTSEVIYAAIAGGLTLIGALRASRNGPATRIDCQQCGYPLVDPTADACPNCGGNPSKLTLLRTGEWDLSQSLRRRRLVLHVMSLVVGVGFALALYMAGRAVPRTYHEEGKLGFDPESKAYHLTVIFNVSFQKSGAGRPQIQTSELTLTFSPPGKPARSFQYIPGEDTFSFESARAGGKVSGPRTPMTLEAWLRDEVGLAIEDPRIRAEADALAKWLNFTTPPQSLNELEYRAGQLKPFTGDRSKKEEIRRSADGLDLWVFPLLAIAPYLFMVAWIERTHAVRSRAIEIKKTRQGEWQSGRVLSVLFTDMVNFVQMTMSRPGPEILEVVRQYKRVVAQAVASRSGRIVKNQGDAFLVVFESPTDAILAALELQRALRLRNFTVPEFDRFQVRVGINTGPVAEEDGDVFGPTVNVAARVQALAAPGEVLFTDSAFKTLVQSELEVERRGETELKGVPGKVVLYAAKDLANPPKWKNMGTAK